MTILAFQQFILAFILAVGLLLTLIELRIHYERSLLYFGVSLIILCAFASIDIWILPAQTSVVKEIFWVRIQHLIAISYALFSLFGLTLLIGKSFPRLYSALLFWGLATGPLFLTDVLIRPEGEELVLTTAYSVIFIPFVLTYAFSCLGLLIAGIKKKEHPNRSVLAFYLAGSVVLYMGGITDMIFLILDLDLLPSFSLWGIFVFGAASSLILAEFLLELILQQKKTLKQLRAAYTELESASNLKKIGESTAIINHEIKNYMAVISSLTQMIEHTNTLNQKGREYAAKIKLTVDRLMDFSSDLLELSKTHILDRKQRLNIVVLIKFCIEDHFSRDRACFHVSADRDDFFIYGDWTKLEHLFTNLFRNSLEAAASDPLKVEIRIATTGSILLISLEDNGIGCPPEALPRIFEAFYSTKKGGGGTGLGMSLSRAIVESHGGKINAFTKGVEGQPKHGLVFHISLPIYHSNSAENGSQPGSNLCVLKHGIKNFALFMRPFQNLALHPRIIAGFDELNNAEKPAEGWRLIGTADQLIQVDKNLACPVYLVSQSGDSFYVVEKSNPRSPALLTEEFIVQNFL